jgi:hypothetical protein
MPRARCHVGKEGRAVKPAGERFSYTADKKVSERATGIELV